MKKKSNNVLLIIGSMIYPIILILGKFFLNDYSWFIPVITVLYVNWIIAFDIGMILCSVIANVYIKIKLRWYMVTFITLLLLIVPIIGYYFNCIDILIIIITTFGNIVFISSLHISTLIVENLRSKGSLDKNLWDYNNEQVKERYNNLWNSFSNESEKEKTSSENESEKCKSDYKSE